ncbi:MULTISPECIES: tetratricopeptide repeat-containing sulfotransferase family protein [Pseudoalteromonas]|uniref:tetratricopeptide repeat-containing sulfotransferase family protein n=1 Tax=Pseudoalteromonas TaxID=53246 RepID=UPI001230FF2C|nr:tetratricopeptide repeat-containing sulfotransferase family protein [Pseudoalteromonas rhizosphaerae]
MKPLDIINRAHQLQKQGELQQAKVLLLTLIQSAPEHHSAWSLLANIHQSLNEDTQSKEAQKQFEMIAWFNQQLDLANSYFQKNDLQRAENITQELLKLVKNEFRALILLGKIAFRVGDLQTYSAIALHNIQLNKTKPAVHNAYAEALYYTKQFSPLVHFYKDTQHLGSFSQHAKSLVAAAYVKQMAFKEASDLYTTLLRENYHPSLCYLRLGNIEKILGNSEKAISYYHQALTITPNLGEAYWSLANLKTYVFSKTEITNLVEQLKQAVNNLNTAQLHFSLAKAYDQNKSYHEAFKQLQSGNNIHKQLTPYKKNQFQQRCIKFITPSLLKELPKPTTDYSHLIFIVSLPRSGSTLVEQIIASHPNVDASYELTEINAIAQELEANNINSTVPYNLNNLNQAQVAKYAQRYLDFIKPLRGSNQYFIDKQPINFNHIGLIKTLFPNAKIIDVRREKEAIAWSLYKHSFSEGHNYSYDLQDLASHINEHKELMAHWHLLYPGSMHILNYENIINNFESTINELLTYCGLESNKQCYEFYNNQRPVLTPSSEQVRKPIYKEALTDWRNYAEYLAPLIKSLK